MAALRFAHPMVFTGEYPYNWAGYTFKAVLGYTYGYHTGVDYNYGAGNQDIGFAVRAIAEGTVVTVGRYSSYGYGRTVIIKHTLAAKLKKIYGTTYLYSRYMHLSSYSVKVGQKVGLRQIIGKVGNDGAYWAHLHLDLWKGNLGNHLMYDKLPPRLNSYLDPFRTIEKHKNEVIAPTAQYLYVKSGEGLSALAKRAGYSDYGKETRWAAIAKLNGSTNWRTYNANLKVGQKVRVK